MIEFDFYDLDLNTQKLCSCSVCKNEKIKKMLAAYYNSLNVEEQNRFQEYSARFMCFVRNGAKKYKITQNSILVASRLKKELNISCYPFIEKIATKGWSTRGGTFSWSIRCLAGKVEKEICSFDAASIFANKKYKLYLDTYRTFAVIYAEKETNTQKGR